MEHHRPESTQAGARLTIDLAALEANWRAMARLVAPADCAAAVKADGYGLGLEAVVARLASAGCRTFFVALPTEGLRVKSLAGSATVYVLNGVVPGSADMMARTGLRPVLGSREELEDWAGVCVAAGRRLPAALHVDTGMNRLGFTMEEAADVAGRRDLLDRIDITLVMSHLACADVPDHPLTARQIERFGAVTRLFPGVPASIANSAGCHLGSALHHQMVRPGIALYGGAIFAGRPSPMRPVVRLEAPILRVRPVASGQSVGYGAAEQPDRDSRIAIVSTGYADGYHRLASSRDGHKGGHGAIEGRTVPVMGRISMDLTAFDVTDVPAAARGTMIELIGPSVPLQTAAAFMGTIDYEVLTSLGRRYERHHVS